MTDRAKFRRHTSEDRREMLVDATLRCLADASVDRLSVRAIAAEAGVSVGLMNHHYASKDALVADAYKRAAADLLAGLREAVEAAPDDPRSRLDAFFTQSFSARVLDPKLLKVWTSFWILADRSSHVQATHERNNLQYRDLLERLLLDLLADAPASAHLRLAAIGLSALIDGLWLEWCLDPTTFTPEEGMLLCQSWTDALLQSAVPSTPAEKR
jgi:AcrR family transcriptional regulator